MKTLIFLIFLSFASLGFANGPFCQQNNSAKAACFQEAKSILSNDLQVIETYQWLTSEVENHREVYRQKKDQFAHLFRFLEHGKLDTPSLEAEIKTEWEKTQTDFETLYQLSKAIRVLEARLKICYQGNCSAYRRVEHEEELAAMQKSKLLLLVKRPLLSHHGIEEFIKKQPDNFVDNDKLPTEEVTKNLIKNASRETAKTLLDKVEALERYQNDREAPLLHKQNGTYIQEYINQLTSKHPEVVDDLLNRFELISPPTDKNPLLCQLSQKRDKEKKREKLVKAGVETSLFVAPLLLGPWGRAGVLGVEGVVGSRLLRWGLTAKEIERGSWVARVGTGVALNTQQSFEVKKLGEECKALEQKYFLQADSKKLQALDECKDEYQDSLFLASLGWATAGAVELPGPFFKLYRAKFTPQLTTIESRSGQIGAQLSSTPLSKNQWAKEFKTLDQGSFTYMDLSKLERVSDNKMKTVPDDYWNFVGNIYSERLNLTPDEIKGFIKSSQDFSSRTKLIVNTTDSIKDTNHFNGGVGIVTSDKMKDLLPLEKAIGKSLERKPTDKVAEIVRLTVSKEADAEKLSKSLINQAAGVIMQDPEIKFVYIYTSKIHGRLYRKLGVTPASSIPHGDRDIIITLKREDVLQLLNNTKN